MKIAVPRVVHAGERRVATTPDVVKQVIKLGFEIAVEAGAGAAASYADEAYAEAGATVETFSLAGLMRKDGERVKDFFPGLPLAERERH